MTKLLIVEDNPEYRVAAEEYFTSRGIEADYASDFKEAMELLDKGGYDAVISDCFFPAETGSEDRELGYKALEILAQGSKAMKKKGPVANAMKQVLDTLGAEGNARVTIGDLFAKNAGQINYANVVGYQPAMKAAIEESASNQPLGVLIAETAKEKGIPFILATSTYHHDSLTQPIQDKYAGQLVDCDKDREDQKATPEFWEKAHRALEARL